MCKEFNRDVSLPWIHELINKCLVCLYYKECGDSNLKTALCHGYQHGNKRNGILR
jgi:hypothetical protein